MVHIIQQFMWGYQPHFRGRLEDLGKRLFETLGIDLQPVALLVGARKPDSDDRNAVCVEPENGDCSVDVFDGLLDDIERTIERHPLRDIFYSDEQSMREKPERTRRDSAKQAVARALELYDETRLLSSFCGTAYPVGNFYVVPVIQLPVEVFNAFPPLSEPIGRDDISVFPSLIHAAMNELLSDATKELQTKDPGRRLDSQIRSAREIVRATADSFMMTPGMAIGDNLWYGLFEKFNMISSLLYEGAQGQGRILLADPENPALEWTLRLNQPVPFRETRWARKVLQMATNDLALIADGESIFGLGNVDSHYDASRQDLFTIDFLEHYDWQIKCGSNVLLRSRYGEPKLPQKKVSRKLFIDDFCRLFHSASKEDADRIWDIFEVAEGQAHGSMLVVAEDAAEEAKRFARQGTTVHPTLMTKDLLRRVSKIDGTILLDPYGYCHAVGVILDGPANEKCTPARGARFNSGVRYVWATKKPRLAIVVSEDHTVDIIPLLRPIISRATLKATIDALEKATLDDYHQHRNWLVEHRFYLNDRECERVNAALDRIESLAHDSGQLYIVTTRLTPNSEMNDSYFHDP